ncbi:uncharacterized protein Rpp14a [Chelonus insularis]|uniref:uncharacterized protein Rpp14a n=1 Tax=Chelonus insularis TaxID=460826 RepID=UPI001588BDDE|nr:uncharacterized protein LOC118068195 [Chelonus insularis]
MRYLDVSLEFPNNPHRDISEVFLKNHVMQSLKQLFGEEGANCSVDLLRFNHTSRRFILRCEDKDYVRLRSSLTLASTYNDDDCVFTVHKASASPFGLLSDGRDYQH